MQETFGITSNFLSFVINWITFVIYISWIPHYIFLNSQRKGKNNASFELKDKNVQLMEIYLEIVLKSFN